MVRVLWPVVWPIACVTVWVVIARSMRRHDAIWGRSKWMPVCAGLLMAGTLIPLVNRVHRFFGDSSPRRNLRHAMLFGFGSIALAAGATFTIVNSDPVPGFSHPWLCGGLEGVLAAFLAYSAFGAAFQWPGFRPAAEVTSANEFDLPDVWIVTFGSGRTLDEMLESVNGEKPSYGRVIGEAEFEGFFNDVVYVAFADVLQFQYIDPVADAPVNAPAWVLSEWRERWKDQTVWHPIPQGIGAFTRLLERIESQAEQIGADQSVPVIEAVTTIVEGLRSAERNGETVFHLTTKRS